MLKRRKHKGRNKKRSNYKKEVFEENVKSISRKPNKRSMISEKENHLSNALSI
jgi:hypothetical protein